MMFRSLAFKWTATLLLTSLTGVVLVGLFAYRTTLVEYNRLRSEQAQALYVDNVTAYYQAYGTWQGLEAWLSAEPDPNAPQDTPFGVVRPPRQFVLIGSDGVVIAGNGVLRTGDVIHPDILTEGTPIVIGGKVVATALLVLPPPELDPRERRYIEVTNQALFFGALGAGTVALIFGLLLSRAFLRLLSQLTQAITAMRRGELDQRVEIHSRDELGTLAQTFNEMSADLARANHLRKQMTADIAHDLRTPLTVIGGYLEALRDGTLKPTPERLRAMNEEVALLQRLVEDLRVLSLADAGELRLVRSAVLPRDLLERVALSFRESAVATNVRLEVVCDPALPAVWIDSERMMQVLGNLVTNAIRHTPSGGSVTLKGQSVGDSVKLLISDTGSGIAPDDLPKVFDRFYRADPSRHTDGGESGLGLAIARSIVEAHGGTLSATSRLNEGTTMMITLKPYPM